MNVGKKILKLRLQSKMSQREISNISGLAVSYLSRLENDRITPSIKTLRKISGALGVPLTALLDREPGCEAHGEKCPVTPNGRCIMNQLFAGRGRKPKSQTETYSPQQLELLRLCNTLLQLDDREISNALAIVMKSLLALSENKEGSQAGDEPESGISVSQLEKGPQSRVGET
ncbi:MAG TPA: helix-turn-helix transcriptional regulator [Acidobacteriota bacterium]|nr:helix-turn-helix transcriptional regulator [Acidobacteriota bacterium]